MCKTIRKLSKFMRPPSSPNTTNQSECRTTKMLPPSGQLLTKSECRNLGHDPGKQDGRSTTQYFEALLVKITITNPNLRKIHVSLLGLLLLIEPFLFKSFTFSIQHLT